MSEDSVPSSRDWNSNRFQYVFDHVTRYMYRRGRLHVWIRRPVRIKVYRTKKNVTVERIIGTRLRPVYFRVVSAITDCKLGSR